MARRDRPGRLAALLIFAVAVAASMAPPALAQNASAIAAADNTTATDETLVLSPDALVVSFDTPVPLTAGPPVALDVPSASADLKPRAIRAQVAKDKAAVRQALADPQRSSSEYFARLQAQVAVLLAEGQELPHHLAVLQEDAATASQAQQGADAAVAAAPAGLQRQQRFFDSLKRIDELNAASGPMLAYGITPFMHLSPEEFRENYLGGRSKPVPATAGRKMLSQGRHLKANNGIRRFKGSSFSYGYTCAQALDWKTTSHYKNPLVASIDWRKAGVITPVRNQGNCGSCVAFANFAAIEASYIQKWKASGFTNKTTDLSEQESMECIAGDQCQGFAGYEYIDRSICKGAAQELASAATRYKGVDSDKCPKVTRTASGVKAYTFVDPTASDVRKALYHNPVAIGIAADDAFMFYSSGVIGCRAGSPNGLNHETTIVAYTQSSSSKYFTVKNSWSSGWGSAGYFNLRADCSGAGALSMYTDPFLTLAIRG